MDRTLVFVHHLDEKEKGHFCAAQAPAGLFIFCAGSGTPRSTRGWRSAPLFTALMGASARSWSTSIIVNFNAMLRIFFVYQVLKGSIHMHSAVIAQQKCPTASICGVSTSSQAGTKVVVRLQSLRALRVLRGVTDVGVRYVSALGGLRELSFWHCGGITRGQGLQRLQHLRFLSLSGCKNVTDDALRVIATLPKLTHLDLERCKLVRDAGLLHMARSYQLLHINVCRCGNVTEGGIRCLPLPPGYLDVHARACAMVRSPYTPCTSTWILAGAGDLDGVRLVLLATQCAHINDAGSDNGKKHIHIASQNGHTEVVSLLASFGADINATTNSGCTSLFIASQNGHLEVVRLLASLGARRRRNACVCCVSQWPS